MMLMLCTFLGFSFTLLSINNSSTAIVQHEYIQPTLYTTFIRRLRPENKIAYLTKYNILLIAKYKYTKKLYYQNNFSGHVTTCHVRYTCMAADTLLLLSLYFVQLLVDRSLTRISRNAIFAQVHSFKPENACDEEQLKPHQ